MEDADVSGPVDRWAGGWLSFGEPDDVAGPLLGSREAHPDGLGSGDVLDDPRIDVPTRPHPDCPGG